MAEATADQTVVKSSGLQTLRDTNAARDMADQLVQGAITSLQKPIEIPSTTGVDLSGLEAEVSRASKQRDETNTAIESNRQKASTASQQQIEGIDEAGKATAEKIYAEQAAAQKEADSNAFFAKIFGITTDDSSAIAMTAKRLTELAPQAEAKLRNIQSMQKVGPLDNPLAWLANQLQLPSAISDYNRDADVINNLQDAIDKGIETGQKAATFAGRGLPKITTGIAAATANLAVATAKQNAAIANENYARQDTNFAIAKLANDITVANATNAMTKDQISNEQMKYQSQINEIALADKHSERMLKAANLLETLQKTKGLDILLEQYDRTMGHPPGTTTRYIFEKFGEPQRVNIVAIGAGSVGADPFTGMLNWFNAKPGPGAAKESVRFFNYLREEAEKIAVTQEIQGLDEKQKPSSIAKRLREQLDVEFKGASKMGSIFYELEPSTMMRAGAVAPDSILGKILEPFTKVSGPVDTKIIIESISANVQNPTEAGAVIAEYYKKNIELRNQLMNTGLAGVKLPSDYKIKNDSTFLSGGLGGQRIQLDLTKPDQATKYVLFRRMEKTVGEGMAKELTGTTQRP